LLFREFSRDVLNIEATDASMPPIPSPFTPFLEEEVNAGKSLAELEHQRIHIREAVKGMQDKLRAIDRVINEFKKENRVDLEKSSSS